jgi:tRNA-splicing endonuclease subunit Sen54
MDEVFGIVPDVPTPYLRRRANPPTEKAPLNAGQIVDTKTASDSGANVSPTKASKSGLLSWFPQIFGKATATPKEEAPQVNTFLSLKQGDKTITLAIVDGGNVGWTRLGRGGFEEHSMVPHGW